MPNNYQTSKLYKIWSPSHPDEIYIGSTTQRLVKRIGEHRRKYKLHLNGKYRYTTSFKIMAYGDARIELIEKFPCKCKEELIAREGYYIRTLDCVNKVIPDRTPKQYYQANRERIAQRGKKYREANREKIAQKKKEYRQANREKIAQRVEKYYKNNRMTCECGSVIRRDYLRMHKKTKKHMNYIKNVVSSGRTSPEL